MDGTAQRNPMTGGTRKEPGKMRILPGSLFRYAVFYKQYFSGQVPYQSYPVRRSLLISDTS